MATMVALIRCHTNKLEWCAVVPWEKLGELRANRAQNLAQVMFLYN